MEANDMNDPIWVVVNAGGNRRKKEVADCFNAQACLKLTEQRFKDQADILAEGGIPARGPYAQARKRSVGDRIVMLQGGGKIWRAKYGSGELMACGRIRETARPLTAQDIIDFPDQYKLVQYYYPPNKPGNSLVGIVFYSLHRAKQRLPKEDVHVQPRPGNKFIKVGLGHSGYHRLNEWWNENCQELPQ